MKRAPNADCLKKEDAEVLEAFETLKGLVGEPGARRVFKVFGGQRMVGLKRVEMAEARSRLREVLRKHPNADNGPAARMAHVDYELARRWRVAGFVTS